MRLVSLRVVAAVVVVVPEYGLIGHIHSADNDDTEELKDDGHDNEAHFIRFLPFRMSLGEVMTRSGLITQ